MALEHPVPLFRAASAWQVSLDLAGLAAEAEADESLYNSLPPVSQVDVFISHSWDCPSWMKLLALCQFLNFDLAVRWALGGWISMAAILLLRAGSVADLAENSVGSNLLTYALVYFPMTVFSVVYCFGHRWCKKTFWFDRICVNQANLDLKAKALDQLPHFVANSHEMLILLDQQYLERLWCNYEIAIFSRSSMRPDQRKSMHFMPLWLPIWVLSTIAIDFLGVLALTLCMPEGGATVDAPNLGTDSRTSFFLLTVETWTAPGIVYASSVMFSFWVHFRRLQFHNILLERMATFDFRNAKCKLESDRKLIEAQIVQLFDEAFEAPISVPLDVADEGLGDVKVDMPLISQETMRAIRPITSYPSEEEVLQQFNAYVRGPMRDKLLSAIGSEVDIPWTLCAVSFLPLTFDALAVTLGCEGQPCHISAGREGYTSTTAYILSNFLGFALECILGYPSIHPLMLRVLRGVTLNVDSGPLQVLLGASSAIGVYLYVFLSTAAVIGFFMVSITRFSPLWLAAGILGFALLVIQTSLLFLKEKLKLRSCRNLETYG